ncbi:MAG: GGDEF domain-containing protein [Micrococcales bacterium]|nr:GGDEF domain-containing protein [Micrococcales bacterium]MCL2666119.1 GGDEF domain-containing protein [Micrococcales bacterium]
MPGTTWALVGVGAATVVVAIAMAVRQVRNRATPRLWRALELVGLAGWTALAVAVQVGGWWSATSLVLAPVALAAVGVFGWSLTQAGMQHWLRWSVVVLVAAVPAAVAVVGQAPASAGLVVTDVAGERRVGPLVLVAVIWVVVAVCGALAVEIVEAEQAVGPLRHDVVWNVVVRVVGILGALVLVLQPGTLWFAWLPVALVAIGLIAGRWSGDMVPLPAGTSSLLDLVSDALVLVGLDGTVIDHNVLGRHWLVCDDDPRALDPALGAVMGDDGERNVVLRGAVLQVRTTTVRDGKAPVARVLSVRDVTELHQMRTELADQVGRDALTGLRNRRYLDHRLSVLIDDAHRTGRPLSIAMVDLDHLKDLNDHFGHPAGDEVIIAVAQVLAAGDDLAVRVGGDEFLVVLDDTDADTAELRGQLWRVAVAALPRPQGQTPVTLSIGVAQLAPGMDAPGLLSTADGALYAAKVAGRNRVRVGPLSPRSVSAGAVR